MKESTSNLPQIWEASDLVKLIGESYEEDKENKDKTRFCFILGSGASVKSGIPTGSEMEMTWMNDMMCLQKDGKTEERVDDEKVAELRKYAEAMHLVGWIKHPFSEIEQAWEVARKENRFYLPSAYYFDIYRLRFFRDKSRGYQYLEKSLEKGSPSIGFYPLALLLTEENRHNLVITTNFDTLVEDALFIYTNKKPLVAGHESLAIYIQGDIERPIIAKVHRSMFYEPFNLPEETDKLSPQWQYVLNQIFDRYTPIVIGYGGGDGSLMGFLSDEASKLADKKRGFYWCYVGDKLPDQPVLDLVEKMNGKLVHIHGFDHLMVEIGATLKQFNEKIYPTPTQKLMNDKSEARIREYNEQWRELLEDPTLSKILTPLDQKEQGEEENRELDNLQTYWDYIRRGLRFYRKGDYLMALEQYNKAIELDSKEPVAYNDRAVVYKHLGDLNKSLDDCNMAINLKPNYEYAYANRGNVFSNRREYEKAIDDYTKAIELNPGFGDAYSHRGLVYKNMKAYDKAVMDCSKAIELAPNGAHGYMTRGNTLTALKRYDEAIKDYTKVIEMKPNEASTYNNRGNAFYKCKKFKKAINDYDKAIKLKPDLVEAYINRGNLYIELDEDEKALKDYKRVIELQPKNADAFNTIGNIYRKMKKYDDAVNNYTWAIFRDDNRSEFYKNRAIVYRALGKWKCAKEDDAKAKELTQHENNINCFDDTVQFITHYTNDSGELLS